MQNIGISVAYDKTEPIIPTASHKIKACFLFNLDKTTGVIIHPIKAPNAINALISPDQKLYLSFSISNTMLRVL